MPCCGGGDWLQRIRGVRANASRRSHAELDRRAHQMMEGTIPHLSGKIVQALLTLKHVYHLALRVARALCKVFEN
jgi:hypothetical protein